jgi:RHS repeat-associated protein
MDKVRLEYGYDRNSNRLWRENPVAAGFSSPQDQLYAYDPINRLTDMQRGTLNGAHTAVSPLTFEQQWGLDAVGNWGTFDQDSSGGGSFDLQQARSHNKVNEITDITESAGPSWTTPGYDAAGNTNDFPQPNVPTSRYEAVYDAWNRLVKLTDPSTGDTVVEYQYDGLNRRTVKTPYVSNVVQPPEHQYYTANWQLIETRRGSSTDAEKQYVWGIRYIDDLVLRDRDTTGNGTLDERLYALQDANYNVCAVTNETGAVDERYEYDAYGAISFYSDDYTSRSSSSYDWDITYAGYRYDADTGLYLVRNRIYHPTLGRWVQRDPLGYVDGMSLYEYLAGAPLSWLDPLGLRLTIEGPKSFKDRVRDALKKLCPFITVAKSGRVTYEEPPPNDDPCPDEDKNNEPPKKPGDYPFCAILKRLCEKNNDAHDDFRIGPLLNKHKPRTNGITNTNTQKVSLREDDLVSQYRIEGTDEYRDPTFEEVVAHELVHAHHIVTDTKKGNDEDEERATIKETNGIMQSSDNDFRPRDPNSHGEPLPEHLHPDGG